MSAFGKNDLKSSISNLSTEVTGAPGLLYRLCWAAVASQTVTDYKVELDDVAALSGPVPKHFECTLGLPCSYSITGFGLAQSSQIQILSAGSCGGTDMVLAESGRGNGRAELLANSGRRGIGRFPRKCKLRGPSRDPVCTLCVPCGDLVGSASISPGSN